MKFVQLGTQIKTRCEKRKIQKIQKNEHYEVHKNHIIKSTSDSLNSEICISVVVVAFLFFVIIFLQHIISLVSLHRRGK